MTAMPRAANIDPTTNGTVRHTSSGGCCHRIIQQLPKLSSVNDLEAINGPKTAKQAPNNCNINPDRDRAISRSPLCSNSKLPSISITATMLHFQQQNKRL